MSTKNPYCVQDDYPKTLIVGIYGPMTHNSCPDCHYDEFVSLVKTLEFKYDESHFMKLRSIDNNIFFTKGKLNEIKELCNEHDIERVLFSELLSPVQERNLEEALGCLVWDRERLILEIFKKAAHSSEGKIQVEMAEIDYFKTRIIGKGRELAQQEGIIGTKGPGETQKEQLKRQFTEKLRQAKKRLQTLERSRETQRKRRIGKKIPLVCLIGYTNAGKSSLLNHLTKSHVLAEDKLFATLDTTTRELYLGADKKILLSDTVGFINQLPHNLIAAFKSTLDELQYANLLLHVIDVSNEGWKNQADVVNQTLSELSVDKPILHVFNKIDKIPKHDHNALIQELEESYQPYIFTQTKTKDGAETLFDFLQNYPF
ncbi:MAG: GTPase HflX [Epsilonproteobacteria bacterium]|nr:GTPase HflX [Campylobacterota bacterium]